jgi:S1-C subfamily serine protease
MTYNGRGIISGISGICLLSFLLLTSPAKAISSETLKSVVSVLPVWADFRSRGGNGGPIQEPEGTGVVIRHDGYIATNLHVVQRALSINIRLSDGRISPAKVVGIDPLTDIAVLKAELNFPALITETKVNLAEPVCTIGNQFGLDLSVTCGVVSAVHRTGTGFNPIEDFIQTDAVVNPGASGGALINSRGRLVGLISAIFTKGSDANLGVNFAASMDLVLRVTDDLIAHGKVIRGKSGMVIGMLPRSKRRDKTGVLISRISSGMAADKAGLMEDDIITSIGARPIRKPSDVTSVFGLARAGEKIPVTVIRGGGKKVYTLELLP